MLNCLIATECGVICLLYVFIFSIFISFLLICTVTDFFVLLRERERELGFTFLFRLGGKRVFYWSELKTYDYGGNSFDLCCFVVLFACVFISYLIICTILVLSFIVEPCIDKSIISSSQLMHIFIKNTLKSHKIHFTPTCFGSCKIHLQGAIIIS